MLLIFTLSLLVYGLALGTLNTSIVYSGPRVRNGWPAGDATVWSRSRKRRCPHACRRPTGPLVHRSSMTSPSSDVASRVRDHVGRASIRPRWMVRIAAIKGDPPGLQLLDVDWVNGVAVGPDVWHLGSFWHATFTNPTRTPSPVADGDPGQTVPTDLVHQPTSARPP